MARRWLLVLLTLGGLLAMHGLADHGSTAGADPATSMSMSMSTSMSTSMSPTSQHHPPEVTSPGAADPVDATSPHVAPTPHPGHDMGAMGLCVVVLAGALLALGLHAALQRRLRVLEPALRTVRRGLARARAPDPPDLLALGVLRC